MLNVQLQGQEIIIGKLRQSEDYINSNLSNTKVITENLLSNPVADVLS